jgi:hypothetical protein
VKVVGAGLMLTLVVTALLVEFLGRAAFLAGLVMGAVATAIELAALRSMRRGLASKVTGDFMGGVVTGLLLRLAGVMVFAALVLWDRALFPPLASGLGFVGVLIPLLFLEVRLVR